MDGDSVAEQNETIDEAYALIVPSYNWMAQRFEAVNSRLQNAVSALIIAPLLAVPIIKALAVNATVDCWLIIALLVFAAGIGCGIGAMYYGDLMLLSPTVIRDRFLDDSPSDFKQGMLNTAARAFTKNRKLVRLKAQIAVGLLIPLLIGFALLAVWGLT